MRLALIILALALVAPAWSADDAAFNREEPVPRHALLIGVSDYQHADKIHNAVNDAKVIAGVLKRLGFAVTVVADPGTDRGALLDAVEAFANTIQAGDVALVFFAGHGIQYQGVNYIVPRDAKNTTPERMGVDNIAVDYVLRTLERLQVGLGLMVLDACRTNPFFGARGATPGLAETVAPAGVLIAFATAPGRVAWSGDQNSANSLYSRRLAARLADQGLRLETMFKKVRADVLADSGQVQQPWENSALLGEFWFNPGPLEMEWMKQQWLDTRESDDYELIVEYLRLYPASPYARRARRWIAEHMKRTPLGLATKLPMGRLQGALYTPRVTYEGPAEFGGGTARAKTNLTLYRNPSFGAAAVAMVAPGDDVRVLSQPDPSAGWTRVNVLGNLTGYVAGVQLVSKPSRTPRRYEIKYVGDEWQLSDEQFREVAAFIGPLSRVMEITIHAGGPDDPSSAKTRQVAFARAVDLQKRFRKIGIGSEKLRVALPGRLAQNIRNDVGLEIDSTP